MTAVPLRTAGSAAVAAPQVTQPAPVAVIHGQLTHGGSERQLYLALRACDRAQVSPHLFISGELGVWEPRIRQLDVPVELLSGNAAAKLLRFRRRVRAIGARSVLSWSAYTNVYTLGLWGLGLRTVGSFRTAAFGDLPEHGRRLWAWASMAGLGEMLTNSTDAARQLEAARRRPTPVRFLPNAVEALGDPALHRARWREALGFRDDELVVIGVGRLVAQKNFARFVDAVALAFRAGPLRALIVGDDHGERAALVAQIRASGLPPDTIRLIDAVPDAREVICAADLYLLTSDFEGMPNVVLEAKSVGLAVVANTMGGIESYLRPEVDSVVTAPDPVALAAALAALANDPARRRALGERGRHHIEQDFSVDATYRELWSTLAGAAR